jgi:hypothetical protein
MRRHFAGERAGVDYAADPPFTLSLLRIMGTE